jgi:hypothetical protein
MAERAARLRWKPSMGTKVVGGGDEGAYAREKALSL